MFWETESIDSLQSGFGTLLDNEYIDKASLEELIDNTPQLVNQYDVGNEKLNSILKRREILESLIKNVTETPAAEHLDENERFKYANSSCAFFTSKNQEIESELIQHQDLLDRLIDFLNTDDELNPLMASFFANSLFSIYTKFNEQMIGYLNRKLDFFDLLFKHIQISAIMDFLLKIFTLESIDNLRVEDVYKWLNGQHIIKRIVNVFKLNDNQNALENSSYLLTYLITKGRQSLISLEEEKRFYQFYNESFLIELVDICFSHQSSAIHILRVLVQFIDYENHFKIVDSIKMKFNSNEFDRCNLNDNPLKILNLIHSSIGAVSHEYLISIKNLHKVMLANLDKFKNLLLESIPDYSIKTTTGLIEKPLGFVRLEIIHLFYALLQANNPEINNAFADNKILEILIDLFFEYEYNSFLHNHVNNIGITVFLNANPSRLKLKTNEQEKLDFLSLNSIEKWKENKIDFNCIVDLVWSDRECLQHAKQVIEEAIESEQLEEDNEFKEAINQQINEFIKQLLSHEITTKTKYSNLIAQIFSECNLLERIMIKYKAILNDQNQSNSIPIPTHKSNLIDFAKLINRFLNEYSDLPDSLPIELKEETNYLRIKEEWQQFTANELVRIDSKIIEVEQSIQNQQTAEQDFRRFVLQSRVKTLILDHNRFMQFNDVEKLNYFFETQFDSELRNKISPEMPNIETDLMHRTVCYSEENCIVIDDQQQFDETNLIEESENEAEQSKLNLTKASEASEQISSLTDKDHLFEPLASSSNISNELNIEMDLKNFADELLTSLSLNPISSNDLSDNLSNNQNENLNDSQSKNQGNEHQKFKEHEQVAKEVEEWADLGDREI